MLPTMHSSSPSIAIYPTTDDEVVLQRAKTLSDELGLTVTRHVVSSDLLLEVTPDRLQLRDTTSKAGPLFCDFITGAMGYRLRQPQQQVGLLKRAIGKAETVIDVTAGLGRDAVMLASVGYAVTAIERSPILATLLRDGLDRAREADTTFPAIGLHVDDSRTLLPNMTAEVIYLDPMFPHRSKNAQVKKEMILTRLATGDDTDATELLATALRSASQRVVVKRPRKASPIAGPAPSHTITGTSVRFDVYVQR